MNSKDIAKLAGVSRSTVSRVVNNYPNLSTETKKKVTKSLESVVMCLILQPEPLLVNLIR